jgi:hypothetical protein
MRVSRERTISLVMLLVGYSALIAGLFALVAEPIIGVLLVLGGSALSLCSAIELVRAPVASDSVSPGE